MADEESIQAFGVPEKPGLFERLSRRKAIFIFLFTILTLGVLGYILFLGRTSDANPLLVSDVSRSEPSLRVEEGLEASVPTSPVPLYGDANYQSENFRVGDISIGGEAEFLLSEDNPEPLEVSSIRGESFTEKNKQEVKLVVSWRTNKLAKSTLSYSKGIGQAKKSIEEEDYSLSHSIIIPGLDQASTYIYDITSADRYGNQVTSESHAVYTGSRSVSLFDLIANAVGEVFGWAVKKN